MTLLLGYLYRKDLTDEDLENIQKWFTIHNTFEDAGVAWMKKERNIDSPEDYLVIAFSTFNGYDDSLTIAEVSEKCIKDTIEIMYDMINEEEDQEWQELIDRD